MVWARNRGLERLGTHGAVIGVDGNGQMGCVVGHEGKISGRMHSVGLRAVGMGMGGDVS